MRLSILWKSWVKSLPETVCIDNMERGVCFFLLFLWWPLWARIINLIIKINLMVNWYNLHGKVKSKDLTRGALRALKILLLLVRNSRIKTFLMYYFNKYAFQWSKSKGWGLAARQRKFNQNYPFRIQIFIKLTSFIVMEQYSPMNEEMSVLNYQIDFPRSWHLENSVLRWEGTLIRGGTLIWGGR